MTIPHDLLLPIVGAAGAALGYWLRGFCQSATITDLQEMEGRIITAVNDPNANHSRLQPLTDKLRESEQRLRKATEENKPK